jgi:hypothetical protein
MDIIEAQVHITLGGTKQEFVLLHGAMSATEEKAYDQLAKEINEIPEGSTSWVPSDF